MVDIWYRWGWPRLKAEADYWIRGLPQGHLLHRWHGRNWGQPPT